MPVLRGRLARADDALRRVRIDCRERLGNDDRLARGGDQPEPGDVVHPVPGAGTCGAHAAARHDRAGRVAGARADLQGPAAEARRSRLVEFRLSGLSGHDVGRHPHLPREHGARGRGPGVAHRGDARARAAVQPHLRPRTRLRGKGEGRGQEAGVQEGAALRRLADRVPGKGRHGRTRGGQGAAERHAEPGIGGSRATVRLPRRGAPRHSARAAAAADRNAEGARARRAEDVQVVRQRDHAARGSGDR